MKIIKLGLYVLLLSQISCATIPKETVLLSTKVGENIEILHGSHYRVIEMYFNQIKGKVNQLIEDTYTPYVIHYALSSELDKYKIGEESLYGLIEDAGKFNGGDYSKEALDVMMEFVEAANHQISAKRTELLTPSLKQEKEVLEAVENAYQTTIHANTVLTVFLESTRKAKKNQTEVLSIMGNEQTKANITDKLAEISEFLDVAIEKGKLIDVKKENAHKQIEELMNKIKNIPTKTQVLYE